MSRIRRRVIAALAGTAVIGLVTAGMASAVEDSKEVRQADFIPGLSDTRAAGHYDFLEEGLHVQSTASDSTGKVAEYYAPRTPGGIPATGSYTWYGTPGAPDSPLGQPSDQIVFDVDQTTGNQSDGQTAPATNDFNIIVGEQVYSTNAPGGDLTDWWYTGGSAKAATHGITCPTTSGGSGSDCHGTLKQWQDAVPQAKLTAYGFSLGSGVKGDGVLRNQTFGGDQYIFTNEAETVATEPPPAVTPEKHTATAPVTYKAVKYSKQNRIFNATFATNACPANDTCRGKRVTFSVYVNGGSRRYLATAGWDDSAQFRQVFSKAGGSRHVVVKANGKTVLDTTVTTN